MKGIFLISVALMLWAGSALYAEDIKWKKVEATDLNLVGKAFDTPNPYHRVDTLRYKLEKRRERELARASAGLAVLFKTNATDIGVSVLFGTYVSKSSYRSYRGVDLYIKQDGKWKWAGMNDFSATHSDSSRVKSVVNHMDNSMKECIMYLPIEAELYSLKVCVPEGAVIEPLESPFRHRIVFHGSSFTQGISCERAGMSYPMQFMRRTGMQVIPLGFSGRCMMQTYFADVLADVDADAYVFDPFSNPSGETIKKRLMPFIERMVAAHPGKPLIFQKTIWWERSNFNLEHRAETDAKQAASDSLMAIACMKYKDVYYIETDAATHTEESSTADGVHPTGYGYTLWEQSIEGPILRILKKYGIE